MIHFDRFDGKNKILILTKCFLPTRDANGNVIEKLAKSLQRKGYFIKILALTDNFPTCKITEWNDLAVKSIYVPEIKTIEQLIATLKIAPIKTSFIILKKLFFKLCGRLYSTYRKLSLNYMFTGSFMSVIKKLLKEDCDFDLCIAIMMPQDLIWAVHRLSSNGMLCQKIPVAIYQLDTYWSLNALPSKYKEDRFKFEREYSLNSLFVMTTPQIVELNTKKEPLLSEKLIPSEFPLIVKPEKESSDYFTDKMIHCIFAGALYPDIRPPEKVISVIASLSKTAGNTTATDDNNHGSNGKNNGISNTVAITNIRFDFFGLGQHLIRKSKSFHSAKNKIVLHGIVPTEEAMDAQLSADILINIDNTNLTQVPSKIFDYISTGKPIVNFYFFDESPTLKYFAKYPLCLNINVNKLTEEQAANLLNSFIETQMGKKIPFEEIEKLFIENTPDYVAEQFLTAYRERIGDFMKARGQERG